MGYRCDHCQDGEVSGEVKTQTFKEGKQTVIGEYVECNECMHQYFFKFTNTRIKNLKEKEKHIMGKFRYAKTFDLITTTLELDAMRKKIRKEQERLFKKFS
jgi:DNA-directed RNA polymerase subunit RPC12/RpoP